MVGSNLGFRPQVKVSAIVSTYNSAHFIGGCLEDLLAQSLYQKGQLEIVVVDCASPGNESEIVQGYQRDHKNITYVRITERETLAGAWNIGAKYAEGEFLTNANTDDRHHPAALEELLRELEQSPELDLVYADVFQSTVPNESFQANPQNILYRYKTYFPPEVLVYYQFGCQPMWRRGVHEKIGYFQRELKAASDYEFNFRFALAGCKARHIAKPLGLFLERSDSLSLGDATSTKEQGELRRKYITPESILRLYEVAGWEVGTAEGKLRAFHDLTLRSLEFEYPWLPGKRYSDPEVAFTALSAALTLRPDHPTLIQNLSFVLRMIGREAEATELLQRLPDSTASSLLQRGELQRNLG